MRKLLCTALLLMAVFFCYSAQALEKADTTPSYLLEAYEKQVKIAHQSLLNGHSENSLTAEVRGAGYTDTDYNGSMAFSYKTNWSTAYVGDTVVSYIDAWGGEAPYLVEMGYIMYDDDLDIIEEAHDTYICVDDYISSMLTYKPQRTGYLTFVFVVFDNSGNMISTNTPLVKITWEWRDDPYFTIGFADDSAFGLTVYLDKASVSVGDTVRGTFGSVDTSLRKYVSATWYIVDDQNNVIDSDNWSGTEYAFNYYMDYTVNHPGWLYFSVVVEDQYGRDVIVETTKIKISGESTALTGTASLNKTSVKAGTPVTATYHFTNSNGKDEFIQACWTIYDGEDEYENWIVLNDFSGTLSFTPTFGDALSFYVYAEDSEYYSWYETASIPIIGAPLTQPLSISGSYSPSTLIQGSTVTVNYKTENGVPPYSISCSASSYAADDTFIDTIYYQDNMPASGSFSFAPADGDYIHIQVEVTDSQGFTDYLSYDYLWLEEPNRVAGDANDDGRTDLYDALLVMQYEAGWNVAINTDCADVNADAKITLADALLIIQYASGANVILK